MGGTGRIVVGDNGGMKLNLCMFLVGLVGTYCIVRFGVA